MNPAAMARTRERIPRIREMLSRRLTMTEIAAMEGISRERVRQIWKKNLAAEFPDYTGERIRLERRQRLNRSTAARWPGEFRSVVDEAARRGIEVSPVCWSGRWRCVSMANEAAMDGLRIHFLRARVSKGYYRFHPPLDCGADLFLFFCGNGNLFIVPAAELRALYPKLRWNSARTHLYIPERPVPVYHNILPRLDIWRYLNAWHLIKKGV